MRKLCWLHFFSGFTQQHATTLAVPHRLLALDQQQAATLTLGGQPQLITLRIDRQAFEQRIEAQQQTTGPGFTHHERRNLQPGRGTGWRYLQYRCMGFADHIAIAGTVAGDTFEIQVAATHERSGPGP
ncbi:hypothetical protein D3C86_1565270 [compost metagenome]